MTEMTMPDVAPPPPPKKANMKVIVPVAIAVVLCCICLVIAGVFAYLGTQGTGPLKMLATATPTRTPTRTPSPTPELSLVGSWTVYFSWDCTGSYSSGDAIFYDDYTFNVNNDADLWGTWYMVGDYVDFTFDEPPNSHYVGTLDYSGDYMEGTMDNTSAMSGCWYATR